MTGELSVTSRTYAESLTVTGREGIQITLTPDRTVTVTDTDGRSYTVKLPKPLDVADGCRDDSGWATTVTLRHVHKPVTEPTVGSWFDDGGVLHAVVTLPDGTTPAQSGPDAAQAERDARRLARDTLREMLTDRVGTDTRVRLALVARGADCQDRVTFHYRELG